MKATLTNIDTDVITRIKDRLDLAEQVISPDIGPPQHRGHRLAWVCPFHPDRNPSLYLNPDKQSYRCFGCGARGDAFTWVMARRHWSFREALGYLAGLVGLAGDVGKASPTRTPAKRNPAPLPLPSPPSAQWQARAQVILQRAQAVLWENAGTPGRAYLRGRGLHDATLRAGGLGWCPRDVFDAPARWGLTGKRVYIPRGVVIPHWVNGKLWSLKVRRFAGNDPAPAEPWGKYGGPRGGQMALYGLDRLSNKGDRPLFIVEAELDALLLWQAAGDQVDVLALGGAAGGVVGADCIGAQQGGDVKVWVIAISLAEERETCSEITRRRNKER